MLLITLFLAALSLAVGIFSYVVSHAPGAHKNTLPFSLFIAASVFALSDGFGYMAGMPPAVRSYFASVAFAAAGVFLLGAVRYVAAKSGYENEWTFRLLRLALIAATLTCLVPGAVYTSIVDERFVPVVGSVYFDTRPTLLGYAVIGGYLGSLLIALTRIFLAWKRAVPFAGYYVSAFSALAVTGIADVFVMLSWSPMPYLLSMGIFAAAVIFGAAIVRQINDDRNALEALRVELERRVMERTAELERSNAELSRAERMAVVGKLAAGIAHELNNPSAAIRASLEDARNELLRSGRTAEVLACVDISLAAVDRVTRIVRQFGAMAGGAESQDTSPVASADLAVAVQAAVKAARDASRPDLAITVRVDGGLWVRGMAAALQEAVAALVSNAVEAIPDGQQGHVEVTAAQDGEWVDLTVRDSGTGMHDDVMARAFEPFFSTKEIGPSSGLGLPVAKGLVETMGGTLKLKSIVGIGTEAAIRLRVGPVCESTSGGKSRPGKADQGTAASAPSARTRPRILLVDDDDLVRVAMQRYLSRDFDVDTAASVRDGLAMADRRYDVILSDVVMPDGGGQRFLRDLTARDPDLAARVIFVTGGSFRGAVQDFLQTQAQPVLNKPVRLSELKAAILRLMSPPAPPAE